MENNLLEVSVFHFINSVLGIPGPVSQDVYTYKVKLF